MQYTLVLAALVTLATAQLALPECASTCFAAAVGSTTCALDDYMCQCTTGKTQIQDSVIPCLCHSACSSAELLGVVQDSNKVCSAALSSAGSTYTAATIGLGVCLATGSAASTPTGSAASASTTGTASGSQVSATGTMTGNAGGSGSASSTASAAQQTGSSAAGMNTAHGLEAVLGLAGLAAFAL
ncbi:SWI/SNF and RSC complex subunit Ssr1 [Elasticomyces elasticus]|nr:SWI/SNF and RSC complex subunit Ssr1 [Elasticomyces elasticus]